MTDSRTANAAQLTNLRGGWLPDYPDFRDYSQSSPAVVPLIAKTAAAGPQRAERQLRVDLREWCSPVETQGPLNSCTANAAIALVEYFERRAFGEYIDASRLFLYKATRDLLGWKGDTGGHLRTTMNALRLFGVPPERYWPYIVSNFDFEPPSFVYALAENFQTLVYYRLDGPDTTGQATVDRVKGHLAAGLPSMFGFSSFLTMLIPELRGRIPFPVVGDRFYQTHAIAAVGYDDELEVRNPLSNEPPTVGALLIRNSWGPYWGEGGYGWLPYEYVLRGVAQDFWVVLRSEWVEGGTFGPSRPGVRRSRSKRTTR